MKTKFKTYAVVLLIGFVMGMLYGALLGHCCSEEMPVCTGPATVEELAKVRASSPKHIPAQVKVRDSTNTKPPLRL